MPAYDSNRFNPPAPVARVSVRNSFSEATKSDIPMLLDTGADVTLLPLTVAKELGLVSTDEKSYELIGFEGSLKSSFAVRAEMIFLGYTFRGQFLLIDQECGIIGRNVLNSLSLLFDGPRHNWEQSSRT